MEKNMGKFQPPIANKILFSLLLLLAGWMYLFLDLPWVKPLLFIAVPVAIVIFAINWLKSNNQHAAEVMNKFSVFLRPIFILIGCIVGIVVTFAATVGMMGDFLPLGEYVVEGEAGDFFLIILLFYIIGGFFLNLLALNLSKQWHPKRWVKRTAIILNIMPFILIPLIILIVLSSLNYSDSIIFSVVYVDL